MKYLFTSMLLMTMCFAKGQIVNIPDANFKAALISKGVDANGDGDIQQTEANAVTVLDINSTGITDLTGIRSFTNLQTLDCSFNIIRVFDMSNHANIESINLANNGNWLDNSPEPYTLDIENCPRLKTVNLFNIDRHSGYSRAIVDLSNCDSLSTLYVEQSLLSSLNISGSKKVRELINFWGISNLKANNCTSLITIATDTLGAGVLGTFDVTGCTNLETILNPDGRMYSNVDLSTCPNLKRIFLIFSNDSGCPYLNLKNGSRMVDCRIHLNLTNNGLPPCINICADDFEIDSSSNWLHFTNFPGAPSSPLVNMNPYCTFTPAWSYNKIEGQAKFDVNNNGCDSTDRNMPGLTIAVADTLGNKFLKYTDATGNYEHYFYTGQFILTPYFPYSYFNINPASAIVGFDTANSLVETRNFCITPNGIHNDLEITFLPTWPAARPGFDAAYTLVYKNRGTTTLSGNVSVNFDNGKMNFISASENVTVQSTGQLTWNYNNLQPFEGKTISVTFNLLPPPVNNIGDTITYLAAITPSANDETAFDNSFILPQRVIGSYDPNGKECLEGSKLDISKIGDYLHYQIHFQNEGTDTAFNIVVADTLSDKLDWNTFEFISSSHACSPQLKNNKAEFIFENIHLPYKAIDEPGSNGWVAFKIKPKPAVVIGDSLNNSAAIYFDFNKPVITNTATTIVSNSSTPVPVKLEYFSINKKENTNQLNWKASCTYGNASFVIERSDDGIHFNAIGNINATSLRCQLPFNFTDNNPVAGKNYYRLKIMDADGISFYSKTLAIGNNKAGIEITAVANNIIYLNSNKQQTITMKVIAADGREILNQKQAVGVGNNNISLQMKNAAKGIYTLIIYTEDGMITKKFMQ